MLMNYKVLYMNMNMMNEKTEFSMNVVQSVLSQVFKFKPTKLAVLQLFKDLLNDKKILKKFPILETCLAQTVVLALNFKMGIRSWCWAWNIGGKLGQYHDW